MKLKRTGRAKSRSNSQVRLILATFVALMLSPTLRAEDSSATSTDLSPESHDLAQASNTGRVALFDGIKVDLAWALFGVRRSAEEGERSAENVVLEYDPARPVPLDGWRLAHVDRVEKVLEHVREARIDANLGLDRIDQDSLQLIENYAWLLTRSLGPRDPSEEARLSSARRALQYHGYALRLLGPIKPSPVDQAKKAGTADESSSVASDSSGSNSGD